MASFFGSLNYGSSLDFEYVSPTKDRDLIRRKTIDKIRDFSVDVLPQLLPEEVAAEGINPASNAGHYRQGMTGLQLQEKNSS